MLTCLVPVLFTFYIQDVLKLKKNNSGAKELIPTWCLCNSIFPQGVSEWQCLMAAVIKAEVCCIKRCSVTKTDLWRMVCLLFIIVVCFHNGMCRLFRSVWLWILKQYDSSQLAKLPTQQQSLTSQKTCIFEITDTSTWNICNFISETGGNRKNYVNQFSTHI